MRRIVPIVLCFLFLGNMASRAQDRYMTRTGQVRFNASTPLEDIDARNHRTNAIFRPSDGALAFVLLIADFQFPRKLMQEHFNENYLESHQYPKAIFSGKVSGYRELESGESCTCNVTGTLNVHGVEQPLHTRAKLTRQPGGWLLNADFTVHSADFQIEIPRLMFKKIAEEVNVTVSVNLEPAPEG